MLALHDLLTGLDSYWRFIVCLLGGCWVLKTLSLLDGLRAESPDRTEQAAGVRRACCHT